LLAVMTLAAVGQHLVVEALRCFGTVRLRVVGGSMLPTLWPGDIVTISARKDEDIWTGDIVTFAARGKIVSHRLIGRTAETGWLVTRGDRCQQDDPPVFPGDVLGVVTRILRGPTHVPIQPAITLTTRSIGWLFRHSALATRVILRVHQCREEWPM
jgi:signal peptidase I